jgi:AraC-like DNA-binding protein
LGIGLVGSQLPHPATMPETPFTYATHPVDPRLQPWIRGAWTFTAGADAPPEHHLPPDGTASLVLVENRGAPGLIALGPRVMPMVVPTVPGVTFKGLRLAAEAAPLLVGAGAAELVPGPVPAPRLGPVSALVVVGALCHDTPLEIAHAIDTLMLPRRDELPPLDDVVQSALQVIRETSGQAPLDELAIRLGVSQRTLQRRVKHATALTPKQHVRIARFFAADLGMLDPGHRISRIAIIGGYADQPHFHHEVAALTGLTPRELAQRVRQTKHLLD